MMDKTPWSKYALIAYLSKKVNAKGLGKTKLQKLIFFLKNVKKIPFDYRYRFYTYGPYCDDLAGDIDYLSAVHALNVHLDSSGFGYCIEPGEKTEWMINKGKDFIDTYKNEIDELVENLASKNARQLELLSTITYLIQSEVECRGDHDILVDRVLELKPRFNASEVESGVKELNDFGYLEGGGANCADAQV